MYLPLNGRIAIVDDNIEEALPLMKVFSKNQMPYVFYKGNDLDYLPEENTRYNDIRLLFLDINLLGHSTPNDKQVKSTLISVLKRIISNENYPYVLVYWSKEEEQYSSLVNDIFENELVDRAPIALKKFVKADFFDLDGNALEGENNLLDELKQVLLEEHVYRYLLHWENCTHISSDITLQELFKPFHNLPNSNWTNNATNLMHKLGQSYAGALLNSQSSQKKIRSSLNALNVIFTDSLERRVNTSDIENPTEFNSNNNNIEQNTIPEINYKLLLSDEIVPNTYSGTVIKIKKKSKEIEKEYDELLTKILKDDRIKNDEIKFKKLKDSSIKIWVNVTPLCDTVQNKVKHHRMVKGFLVSESEISRKTFHNNEAIFMSPKFNFNQKTYIIILDFRHFFTLDNISLFNYNEAIFRLRQQLLAEIQSKLARHISRQGILFLS